jgi:hypothetical protein
MNNTQTQASFRKAGVDLSQQRLSPDSTTSSVVGRSSTLTSSASSFIPRTNWDSARLIVIAWERPLGYIQRLRVFSLTVEHASLMVERFHVFEGACPHRQDAKRDKDRGNEDRAAKPDEPVRNINLPATT